MNEIEQLSKELSRLHAKLTYIIVPMHDFKSGVLLDIPVNCISALVTEGKGTHIHFDTGGDCIVREKKSWIEKKMKQYQARRDLVW